MINPKIQKYCVLIFTVAFLSTGCTGVVVDQPVGTQSEPLKYKEWTGDWLMTAEGEKRVFHVAVQDEKEGRLAVGFVEKEGGELKYCQPSMWLRSCKDLRLESASRHWLLTSADLDSSPTQKLVFCGLLRRTEENSAMLWFVNGSGIKQYIESGKLRGGPEEKGAVFLESPSTHDLDLITSPGTMLLAWMYPIILTRVNTD